MGSLVVLACANSMRNVTGIVISGCAFDPGPAGASPFGIESLYSLGQSGFGVSLNGFLASVDPKGDAAPIKVCESMKYYVPSAVDLSRFRTRLVV